MSQNTVNHNTGQRSEARSCLNRSNQGVPSSRVVLRSECQQTYNDLSARFFSLFKPRDILEHELVTNLINARWRIRRLEAASRANLELAIEEARLGFEEKYANLDIPHEHALAYRAIAQNAGQSDLMGRQEDREHRIFDRSYRLLARHRGKHAGLPSNEDLLQAELDLPSDNMLQPQPVTRNEALEPEPPPPIVVKPSAAKPTKPAGEEDDETPRLFSAEEYARLKPFFDWLTCYPGLREEIAKMFAEYRKTHEIDFAA